MSVSRREFVAGVAAGSAGVLLGAPGCGNPVHAAPYLTAVVSIGSPPYPVATLSDDPTVATYGQIFVPVPRYPDLVPVGGAVTVLIDEASLSPRTRPFKVPGGGILLVHRGQPGATDEYVAVDSPCPHASCPLGYAPTEGLVECPCHASRFRATPDLMDPNSYIGQVVHLPAMNDLAWWNTSLNSDGTVVIDLNFRHSGIDFPAVAGGKVVIPIAKFEALAMVGGSLVGQPHGLADTLIVIRVDATTVKTLSAVCTHLQCSVGYSAAKMNLPCPCHSSAFGLDGVVTIGPAKDPLKVYPTTFDGATITISVA